MADRSLINRDLNARTLKIKGSNYQKAYPPENGEAGLPGPNSDNAESANLSSIHAGSGQETSGIPANDWMVAFNEIQKNTLEAQKSFQDTIAESHAQFLNASEAAFKQLEIMSGNPQDVSQQTSFTLPTFNYESPTVSDPVIKETAKSEITIFEFRIRPKSFVCNLLFGHCDLFVI